VLLAAAIGFGIGKILTAPSARAAATHRYTLRVGDKATIPAVNQRCAVYLEGGAPELYCARPRHPRHQVTIFRDRLSIWKVGNPDQPAGRGSPSPVSLGVIPEHWARRECLDSAAPTIERWIV
jgi:hypothetical protein